MGIKGLLGVLKPYVEKVHVSKYADQRVGIDCYSWLHKGAYACSRQLCESGGLITGSQMPAYVAYCAHRIQMLKYNKVIPVVVFDGARLPMKAETEHERRRNKDRNLEEARSKLTAGNIQGAEEAFQRCIDVTPEMALQVIQYLRKEGVEFVVAPYEADAQLAALANQGKENGGIAAIITEDSDLLAYGCSNVLYKMDKYGNAEEISTERIFSGPQALPQDQSQVSSARAATCLSFRNFSQELFLGMCILAGCDFLSNIPGIGIVKAHTLVKKYRNMDRALSRLKLDASLVVPNGYAQSYARARATFAHARIYDTATKRLAHLNPLPDAFSDAFGGDINFLGPEMPPSTARAIAEGRVNPLTFEPFKLQEKDTWLKKSPPRGGTWQPAGGATWRQGRSPKRAKKSPPKSSPLKERAAVLDLSDSEEEQCPPPKPPSPTVDLSMFRNLVRPMQKASGLSQSVQRGTGFHAEEPNLQSLDPSSEPNRRSLEESLRDTLPSKRPVLLDLLQNPFKRRTEGPSEGATWVRQLTTLAPKVSKPLTLCALNGRSTFGLKKQEEKLQTAKVSRFFKKPVNPPFKPPFKEPIKPPLDPPEAEAARTPSEKVGCAEKESPVKSFEALRQSVPAFGSSMESKEQPRQDCEAGEVIPATPSEPSGSEEPLEVPGENVVPGLEEEALEGLESTWAGTAASQAAANEEAYANREEVLKRIGTNDTRREVNARVREDGLSEDMEVNGEDRTQDERAGFVDSNSCWGSKCDGLQSQTVTEERTSLQTERAEPVVEGLERQTRIEENIRDSLVASRVETEVRYSTGIERVESPEEDKRIRTNASTSDRIDFETLKLLRMWGPSQSTITSKQKGKRSSILSFFKPKMGVESKMNKRLSGGSLGQRMQTKSKKRR